ncbi:5813_t:CDS:2, partial [Funneliformis geosporum]
MTNVFFLPPLYPFHRTWNAYSPGAFASLPLYPFLIYWNASLFRIFRERASLSIPYLLECVTLPDLS